MRDSSIREAPPATGAPPSRRDEVERHFRRYRRTGDRSARNAIVELHLGIPDYYVRRYAHKGVPADDLRQTALLTMVRAVDRFDPDLGIEFATFARRTIEGELKRYFRDRTWSVRPPRRTQELHLRIRRVEEELTHDFGRAPTVRELAETLDETIDHVLEALEAGVAHSAASIDAEVGERQEAQPSVVRALAAEDGGYHVVEQQLVVNEVLETLGERERTIIRMRFYEGLTQPEIAARIGVSQSYLSRLLRKTLVDLRERLGDQVAESLGVVVVAAEGGDGTRTGTDAAGVAGAVGIVEGDG